MLYLRPPSTGVKAGAEALRLKNLHCSKTCIVGYKNLMLISIILLHLTDNGSVGALEAWPLRVGQLFSRTEVISPNGLADPLDIEILEL